MFDYKNLQIYIVRWTTTDYISYHGWKKDSTTDGCPW